MSKSHIRLIHNKDSLASIESARNDWGFDNALQLALFESWEKTTLIIIPVNEASAHTFVRALKTLRPQAILDTRAFPDFFSVYESTDRALSSFEASGIPYIRSPIIITAPREELWQQLSVFADIVEKAKKRFTDAPIFVLTSTKGSSSALTSRLRGAVSDDIKLSSLTEKL